MDNLNTGAMTVENLKMHHSISPSYLLSTVNFRFLKTNLFKTGWKVLKASEMLLGKI